MAISTLPPSTDIQPEQPKVCSNYVQQVGTKVSNAAKNALKDLGVTLSCDERTLEKRESDTEKLTPIQYAEKMVQADKLEFSKEAKIQLAALSMDEFEEVEKVEKKYEETKAGYEKTKASYKKNVGKAQEGYNEAQKEVDDLKKGLELLDKVGV